MNIIEYNKRCAEFRGLKRGFWISQEKPLTDDKKQWWDIKGKTFLGTSVYYDRDLKFHSDWNWIMDLVEAIENINLTFIEGFSCFTFKIKDCRCVIEMHPQFALTDEKLAESFYAAEMYTHENSKMEAAVVLIDKFLIWYKKEVKC